MSISEKEAVLREREAVKRAVKAVWNDGFHGAALPWDWEGTERLAVRLYPLPTVTRPRVVTDQNGHRWKWENGFLQFSTGAGWLYASPPLIGEASYAAVRDVLSNPTEEVEE